MATLAWLWKHRTHIALIALALGAFFWLQRHDANIRTSVESTERTACALSIAKAENAALTKTITIKRRQDEIRNAPRSDARTLERLRDHSF